MTYESVFAALSNPTRQQVMLALRDGPQTVRQMTDRFDVSQPLMSQHLKVLKDAGLVAAEIDGTRRRYHVRPEGLARLRDYLETHWTAVLSGLDDKGDTHDT